MLKSILSWFTRDSKDNTPPPSADRSPSGSKHIIVDDTGESIISIPAMEDTTHWPSVITSSCVENRILPPVSGLLDREHVEDKIRKILDKFENLDVAPPQSPRKKSI